MFHHVPFIPDTTNGVTWKFSFELLKDKVWRLPLFIYTKNSLIQPPVIRKSQQYKFLITLLENIPNFLKQESINNNWQTWSAENSI